MTQLNAPYSKVADVLTEELQKRKHPPRRVPRNTIHYWVNGNAAPNWLMLEWLEQNAESEEARKFAADLLTILEELDRRLS